jgi:hypothetical protein
LGDAPPEHSCDDGKQNGRETGIDCGGPDCPPCPEEPTGPCDLGVEGNTFLSVSTNSGKMVWHNVRASSLNQFEEPYEFEVTPFTVASLNTINIDEIIIEYATDYKSPCAQQILDESIAKFFTNRGLGLPSGWDYTHAVKYSAYFLEMYWAREIQIKAKVIAIKGSDANTGKQVVIEGDNLRHWINKVGPRYWEAEVLWSVPKINSSPGQPDRLTVDFVSTNEIVGPVKGKPVSTDVRAPMNGWEFTAFLKLQELPIKYTPIDNSKQ